ncbi:hypothetical protein R1sor_008870 [Riccia sorocarpa]|uniref:Uncharacterized protein n=1 Tax=Riccia sorocarpa TaxID=122646 RepID=A0ABD3H682_9MARC
MVEAKAAKFAKSKDKGKAIVQEAPKKKSSAPTQAPREKLLVSSIAAETARLSRESKTDTSKCKRESQVTPPPPRIPVVVESETSEDKEDIPSDKDQAQILQEAFERRLAG